MIPNVMKISDTVYNAYVDGQFVGATGHYNTALLLAYKKAGRAFEAAISAACEWPHTPAEDPEWVARMRESWGQ